MQAILVCNSLVAVERSNKFPKVYIDIRHITEADCHSYITELLPRNSDSHRRVSRYANCNIKCTVEKWKEARPLKFMYAKHWNGIPLEI